ncbi:hypothetical protein SDC9_151103 [bioreactor metagenome]|uniref:Uncharacterized protein n=1 Tax=bioreactor metagenome TaxID=1076179 RepID=A0A645ERR5_9ZZZZ
MRGVDGDPRTFIYDRAGSFRQEECLLRLHRSRIRLRGRKTGFRRIGRRGFAPRAGRQAKEAEKKQPQDTFSQPFGHRRSFHELIILLQITRMQQIVTSTRYHLVDSPIMVPFSCYTLFSSNVVFMIPLRNIALASRSVIACHVHPTAPSRRILLSYSPQNDNPALK